MMPPRIASLMRNARRRLAGPRPLILMYHRVAESTLDPWDLSVSPARFDEQMDHLARRRRPMRMDAFVAALEAGRLPADAVAVTFDDGYVDNLVAAMPILAAHAVPATLFLTTGAHARGRSFWWDALSRIVLEHAGPVSTSVRIGDAEVALAWDAGPDVPGWRGWEQARSARQAAFATLWGALRYACDAERTTGLDRLRTLLGGGPLEAARAMTDVELLTLVDSGQFDIGAHTVTHPVLTALPPGQRRHEIAQSRRDCEALVGRPVAGFAYPYGDLNQAVRDDVVACGFGWACSTEGSCIAPKAVDRYRLPRVGVGDWTADRFAAALSEA